MAKKTNAQLAAEVARLKDQLRRTEYERDQWQWFHTELLGKVREAVTKMLMSNPDARKTVQEMLATRMGQTASAIGGPESMGPSHSATI